MLKICRSLFDHPIVLPFHVANIVLPGDQPVGRLQELKGPGSNCFPQPESQPQPPLSLVPRHRFIVLNPRPAARLGLPFLARHGLNLGVEARVAQRLVLIERQANVIDGLSEDGVRYRLELQPRS